MVLPLILVGIFILWIIFMIIVTFWYIILPLIIICYILYRHSTKNEKQTEFESRRSKSDSYGNYSQSDYNSNYNSNYYSNYYSNYNSNSTNSNSSYNSNSNYNYDSSYNSNSNGEYKKNTNDNSYEKINDKSKKKSKASQSRENRVNSRLEKYQITPAEAKIIFGSTWRAKLGKQEWEFYYVVRYIEIDFEFDYNNRFRNKYGHLYSKVLQIIKIVMDENADLREKEGKQYRYDRQTYDDFDRDSYEKNNYDWNNYDWNNYDYNNKDYNNKSNFNQKSNFNNEDITKAYDLFGLTKESTKEQIKTKYRELTLKFHPDKNKSKDSTIKMTEINRAYEIIIEVLG